MLLNRAKSVSLLKFNNLMRIASSNKSTTVELKPHLSEEINSQEWDCALPYNKIPGYSGFGLIRQFLPGGKFHGVDLNDFNRMLFAEFGPIMKIGGNLGRPDTVFLFEPSDFEKLLRSEGQWPIRVMLEVIVKYRKKHRPDVFKDMGGLLTEQGEAWQNMRTIVNPVMMQPKNVQKYILRVDEVAKDFLSSIKIHLDNNTMPSDLYDELNKWALETVGYIALDTRLGVFSDPKAQKIIDTVQNIFHLSYQLEYLPSLWRLYETRTYKKMMTTLDTMTDMISGHIERAAYRVSTSNRSDQELSVMEKLVKIDPHVAFVMAFDMFLAGIDTTSTATTSILYFLAKHPQKQAKLREEIIKILPYKDSDLNEDSFKSVPYMRACLKEAQRLLPVVPGFPRTTANNFVFQGYQVPKGTFIACTTLVGQSNEKYFPKALEYLPERWLKDEATGGCPSAEKTSHPFSFLPFGFGPRSCIGKRFAELEIMALVSRILREYAIEWVGPDMKYKSRMINIPAKKVQFKFYPIKGI